MQAEATAPARAAPAAASPSDRRVFVPLACAHAMSLLAFPSMPVVAIGLWWNGNTISHNFVHRPFFSSPAANRAFSAALSVLLGLPQTLWRQLHLRHHADLAGGVPRPFVLTTALATETTIVLAFWAALAWNAPEFLLRVYLPGWVIGLGLCHLQGHFEHSAGTTSHYGRVYNVLFFNDGYHAEHHRQPAASWRDLPAVSVPGARTSRWPPVLRWLDDASGRPTSCELLERLERLVLHAPFVQGLVIRAHERAFRALLAGQAPISRVTIVGGGLFPRTALVLRTLLPQARLTIVDASEGNLSTALAHLDDRVIFECGVHEPGMAIDADLVVVPLAYRGDRKALYRQPPAARVAVHDWIWNPRGRSARVSWLLLKRINLIER